MITYWRSTIRRVRKSEKLTKKLRRLAISGAYMQSELLNPFHDGFRNVRIIVAFDGKEPIGWSFYNRGLVGVYVAPEYRRQMIGETLVRRLGHKSRNLPVVVSMTPPNERFWRNNFGAVRIPNFYDNPMANQFPGYLVNGEFILPAREPKNITKVIF